MSPNIKNASGGKELTTMTNGMMNTMYNNTVSCGASASYANAQASCAYSATMTNVNIANILDAMIRASIIISLLSIIILGLSQILAVLLPLSVITLLACEKGSVVARLLTRTFA